MSIVIYYPEAADDNVWMARESIHSLCAGLESADLHWYVNTLIGSASTAQQASSSGSLDGHSSSGRVGGSALTDEQIFAARLDSAAVVHAVTSTTAVQLVEARRRGKLPRQAKIVWVVPPVGKAMRERRQREGHRHLSEAVRSEEFAARQRWTDHQALELCDATVVESLTDRDAFAAYTSGRDALEAAGSKILVLPPVVEEPPLLTAPARTMLRQRLGLETAFVVAIFGDGAQLGLIELRPIVELGTPISLMIIRNGRAWIHDARGWSDRGYSGQLELLTALDAWIDSADGEPNTRRLTAQALSLGVPGVSFDPDLSALEGVVSCVRNSEVGDCVRALPQTGAEEFCRRGTLNRAAYLNTFEPTAAARRYFQAMTDVAGAPLAPFSPRRRQNPAAFQKVAGRVSVILPVYNVGRYLNQCLESICSQTYENLEIIIINDGSTDSSAGQIYGWARKDSRILIIDQPNRGLSAARNAGIEIASGEYICFVDGDDWIYSDYVETLIRHAERNAVDLVACAIDYIMPDGERRYHSTLHSLERTKMSLNAGVIDLSDKTILADIFPSAWNKLYRRELFDSRRFPTGLYYEDHPVFFSIGVAVDRMGYIEKALYCQRREREDSITQEPGERLYDIFPVLRSVFTIVTDAIEAPASLKMFKQVALRLLWERSNLVVGRKLSERFARTAERFLEETGVNAVEPRAMDEWIPSATVYRFQELRKSQMQCSVVLTYANDASYIGELLHTLEHQTLRQIEVIAVDNGSVDGASAVVSAKCAVDPRFTKHVHAGSLGGARNAGAAVATGKYVVFVEGNDLISHDMTEKLVSYAQDFDADVAICAFDYFNLKSRHYHNGFHTSSLPVKRGKDKPYGLLELTERKLMSDLLAFPCNKLLRRTFLEASELRFEVEGFFEEHAFWYDVSEKAPRVAYTSEALYHVRDEPSARRLWSGGGRAFDVVQALRSLARRLHDVDDRPLLAKLCVRLAWERLTFALTTPVSREAFAAACLDAVGQIDPDLLQSQRDEYIPPEFVSEMLNLSIKSSFNNRSAYL